MSIAAARKINSIFQLAQERIIGRGLITLEQVATVGDGPCTREAQKYPLLSNSTIG